MPLPPPRPLALVPSSRVDAATSSEEGGGVMGMFDEVVCEVALPDGFTSDQDFQTKDFDCTLTRYRITEEGRLLRAQYEWVESETAFLGHVCSICGWEDIDFHGTFRFYDYDWETKDWHEYEAKFTDGELVGIAVIEEAR